MKIRQATINDIDEIHALGENVEEFDTTGKVVTFWPKHILRNCIQSKTDFLFVAEDKNETVGFLILNNSPVFKKAVIENIFVSPDRRKEGIGQKLITAATSEIKKTDCEYICILIESDNQTAINFYINHGFNKGKDFAWLDKVLSKEFSK